MSDEKSPIGDSGIICEAEAFEDTGAEQIKRVYFICFPEDSPLLSMLPDHYERKGVFPDIPKAIAAVAGSAPKSLSDGVTEERGYAESVNATESMIALVNCSAYYRQAPLLQKEPDNALLGLLDALMEAEGKLSLRLLMPEEKSTDQNLLIEMMSRGYYDFWFLPALGGALLREVLATKRSFREMEAYLATLPLPVLPQQEEGQKGRIAGILQRSLRVENILEKWFGKETREIDIGAEDRILPENVEEGSHMAPFRADFEEAPQPEPSHAMDYGAFAASASAPAADRDILLTPAKSMALQNRLIRRILKTGERIGRKKEREHGERPELPFGATILFYSEEDCLLPYALAFLTASYLAASGRKALLSELPGSGSRLAETLGLRHPERNLHHALRHYASGGERQWERFCFNGPSLYSDPRSIDKTAFSKHLPEQLYFLPDQDTEEKLYPLWDGFLASLVHWAVIEEKFSYILYVGFGDRRNLCWKDGLVCSYKIIAFSPWPSGFNEIPDLEHVWRRRCLPAFDGSWGTQYIREESKCLRLKDALIVPYTVKADFLQMSAFQRESSDFSPESRLCLEMLCHRLFPEEKQREAKDRKLIFREEF